MRTIDAPTTTAILGPTNTGKTHDGIARMLAHPTGVMGFPLRLLAREAYERVKSKVGAGRVALITGEERIGDPRADYVCATTEAMPLDAARFFVGLDEIQLAADRERGHVFTDRLLHARGAQETVLLGAETMRGVVDDLVPGVSERARPRLSTLRFAGHQSLGALPARSAIVAFTTFDVYRLAERVRREKGGAAVVLGALSPRARNAQVALFQSGEVDHIVATDAIGMGLNLDVAHVAFASTSKHDGQRRRALTPAELAQIAGRAGRAQRDGSFGTTLDCAPIADEVARAIAEHRFAPVDRVYWRESALDTSSIDALLDALQRPAPHARLMRAHDALDHETLRALKDDVDVRARATDPERTALLWACCRVPDFVEEHTDAHARLIKRLFTLLVDGDGRLPPSVVRRALDRTDVAHGDVDQLTARIAHVRTWAYVAHRSEWHDDAAELQARARAIEDRLSDALHLALTERFVDRVARVTFSRTREELARAAQIDDEGKVVLAGETLGSLDGLVARVAPRAVHDQTRAARAKAFEVLARQHVAARVDALLAEPSPSLVVVDRALHDGGAAIAVLERGPRRLLPNVRVVAHAIEPRAREALEQKLRAFARDALARVHAPLTEPCERPLARALCHRLVEAGGTLLVEDAVDLLRALDDDDVRALRARGVTKGALVVDARALRTKDALPWRRALALLDDEGRALPDVTRSPPSLVVDESVDDDAARALGYLRVHARMLRADLVERVLSEAEQHGARRRAVAISPRWLSLLGAREDEVRALLSRARDARDDGAPITRPRARRRRSRASRQGAPAAPEATPADAASHRDHSRESRG